MKKSASVAAIIALLSLSACSNLTQQEQQALTGGAIGATGGAIIGALAGSPAIGAAVGGAAGTAAGAMWDDISKRVNSN